MPATADAPFPAHAVHVSLLALGRVRRPGALPVGGQRRKTLDVVTKRPLRLPRSSLTRTSPQRGRQGLRKRARTPASGAPPLRGPPRGSGSCVLPGGDVRVSATQVSGHPAAVGKKGRWRRGGYAADTVRRRILRQKWGVCGGNEASCETPDVSGQSLPAPGPGRHGGPGSHQEGRGLSEFPLGKQTSDQLCSLL